MNLVITPNDLQKINKATFDAFLESGKYAYSKAEAYKVFGKNQIELLITNKLLKNTSELPGKCRFLLSDIIVAFHIWNKNMK
ncbi:MAG: hypothetical protein QM660_08755 [Dysgonomonas sp.]